MDFFGEQDRAKRSTAKLMVIFGLILIGVTSLILAGVWLSYPSFFCDLDPQIVNNARTLKGRFCPDFIDWKNVVATFSAIAAILSFMSILKYAQLASGGKVIAEAMGGRQLNIAKLNAKEKRMLNVVEEISIAAGCPVPLVYVIDSPTINAFAAGTTVQNAVIGMTSGALEHFTRDELQAVVGHEFSHILNGDMKLNMNLIGACYGILGFYYIGRSFFRIRGSGNNRKGGTHPGLIIAGLGLMAIGGIGYFLGSIIKASVSRQREFLADASAVQFTRNPSSMESALKKTATVGSILIKPNTAEVSHMLFSDGIKRMVGGVFATHPPLLDRLKKINPRFRAEDLRKYSRSYQDELMALQEQQVDAALSGLAPLQADKNPSPVKTALPVAPAPVKAKEVIATTGQISPQAEVKAADFLKSLDPDLRKMTREPYGARALVFAILLSENEKAYQSQASIITRFCGQDVLQIAEKAVPKISQHPVVRLPLIDLCLPALRNLSLQQTHIFLDCLQRMVEEDKHVNIFEFTLYTVVKFNLHRNAKFGLKSHLPKIGIDEAIACLVGGVVRAGAEKLDAIGPIQIETYRQTMREFPKTEAYRQSVPDWDIAKFEAALLKASSFSFQQKKYLLQKLAEAAAADDYIDVKEVEIIRGIGDRLACPIPPSLVHTAQIAVA